MTATHSPLPPPMPVTLDTIAAKLDHAVLVLDLMGRQVQRLDDTSVETARVEKSMRQIALRLSSAAMAMSAARVAAALAPTGLRLVVTAGGAFVGGLTGSILWQLWHVSSAFAH